MAATKTGVDQTSDPSASAPPLCTSCETVAFYFFQCEPTTCVSTVYDDELLKNTNKKTSAAYSIFD